MTMPADKEEAPEATPETAAEPAAAPKPPRKPLPAWVTLAGIVLFVIVALTVGYLIWLLANTFELSRQDNTYGMYGVGRVVDKKTYEDVQGWGSELMIDKKPDLPARIRFLLHDKMRKPITDAEVGIWMTPVDGAEVAPTKADLKMVEPGVYRGEVNIPQGGLWEARIQVKEHGNAYQITQRVTVPVSEKEKADKEKADKATKAPAAK